MSNDQSHEQINADNWMLFAFAALSWLCSVLNLVIIKKMGMWNGYILLITSMAVFQLIYDTSFMMRVIPGYAPCIAWHMMGDVGGLGSSFWTNVMCFVVLYVLLRARSISIFKLYPYFFLFGGALPIIFAIISFFALTHTAENDDGDRGYLYCTYKYDPIASFINNFYYWGRIVSIVFNFVAFVFAWIRLHRMGIQPYYLPGIESTGNITASITTANTHQNGSIMEDGRPKPIAPPPVPTAVLRRHNDPQHVALTVLVNRMKYYPFWQAVCRFFSAWNEYQDYEYSTPVISALASISAPSLGVCMFVVFLVSDLTCGVQPLLLNVHV